MSKNKYASEALTTSANSATPTRLNRRKEYSSFHLHAKRNRKRSDAEERQAAYNKLSIAEKLKTAGKKETAKLQKRLATHTPPQVKPAPLTQAEKDAKVVATVQNAAAAAPKAKKKVAKK